MAERRTQTERAAESRARLVGAAMRLLGTRGYARTSLVEIGKEAGVSRGLVIHHFGSKEACMRAVVEAIRENMQSRLAVDGAHGLGALDRLFDVYFDALRSSDAEASALYVILIEAITSTPGLRPDVAETNALIRGYIVDLISEAVRSGEARGGCDAEALAAVVEGILRGLALQWLADPDGFDLDAAISSAKAAVRAVLTGPSIPTA